MKRSKEQRRTWPSKFLAETKLADGALFDVVDGRNELIVEWLGMRISPPTRLVQFYLKLGKGTCQSTFVDLELSLTSNV